MDELRQARQLRDDLRALKQQYPELTTPEAQARLSTHLRTQIEDEGLPTHTREAPMPAKDQRSFGEDLVRATVPLPKSLLAEVDKHIETLRRQVRWMGVTRAHALRDLIEKGLDALERPAPPVTTPEPGAVALAKLAAMGEPDLPPVPPVEPAQVAAGGAIPPVELTPQAEQVELPPTASRTKLNRTVPAQAKRTTRTKRGR